MMTPEKMQTIIEAALMVAGQPLTIAALQNLFSEEVQQPTAADVRAILSSIQERFRQSGLEIQEVASGFRLQAKAELSPWLSKLWAERPPRYSRAFLETLAIIAYKQPVTRAEIEEIRGVTISSNIMKTLQEREWIRILGYREVPGRPAIYGTTKEFLDYFNLKSLTELPSLTEFKTLETQEAQLQVQLAIQTTRPGPDDSETIPEECAATMTNAEESNVVPLSDSVEKDDTADDELATG